MMSKVSEASVDVKYWNEPKRDCASPSFLEL